MIWIFKTHTLGGLFRSNPNPDCWESPSERLYGKGFEKSIFDKQFSNKIGTQQMLYMIINILTEPMYGGASGLYLGYLSGWSFSPKILSFPRPPRPPPPPQKKVLLSLQYISNYVKKIIQARRGQWTHCNICQNCRTLVDASVSEKQEATGLCMEPFEETCTKVIER